MYVPSSFAQTDKSTLHEFMERHSFALLVSGEGDALVASHLPLLLDREHGPLGSLVGHMARANEQWRTFSQPACLAIFSGPHAYISPAWYEAEHVVPTWNYMAVHAYGRLRLIEDQPGLEAIVRRTVEVYERGRSRPWSLAMEGEFAQRLLGQIVGFRMEIERLEGKWKLSQNQPGERRQKVLRKLEERSDENSAGIAAAMRALLEQPGS
jgi:transcriptional regulator